MIHISMHETQKIDMSTPSYTSHDSLFMQLQINNSRFVKDDHTHEPPMQRLTLDLHSLPSNSRVYILLFSDCLDRSSEPGSLISSPLILYSRASTLIVKLHWYRITIRLTLQLACPEKLVEVLIGLAKAVGSDEALSDPARQLLDRARRRGITVVHQQNGGVVPSMSDCPSCTPQMSTSVEP
jgi:hypothetical protein